MDTRNDDTATAVMARFGKAYFRKDPALLAEVLTEDAQWHFAFGVDVPDGRVRRGVAGFMQGIDENAALFETLRFEDTRCRWLDDATIVMTYQVRGRERGGSEFALRGVELITLQDGRIARKDVFWKQHRTAFPADGARANG
ncbi:MAG: nuclear transport factor 2 family protein [Burkholderiaceae bacterium]